MADATNENGLVTTSSPSLTPTARSARCSPAVPLDTALACGAPTRAANARSNSGTRGPSESCPERSTSSTARSSASPSTGRASGIVLAPRAASARGVPLTPRGGVPGCMPYSSESTSASQEAAITFSETPIEPQTSLAVGGIEQHPRDRARALGLIEDPHLEVDELDVAQVRVDLADRVAQRLVERVHRAVALGGAHVALAVRARS